MGARLRAWIVAHLQALFSSVGHLVRNPAASLMTAGVIGISLALPAGLYSLLYNAQRVSQDWGRSAQISLFLKLSVDDQAAAALASRLRSEAGVARVQLITREQALDEYRRISGFGQALKDLEQNPLPAVVVVQPAIGDDLHGTERLLQRLRQIPEVDVAQFDTQWVKRLYAIMHMLGRIVAVLAALLAVGVLLVVGNTIRLGIYSRRAEIEIARLFGATPAFIRRPFLYSGMWYGLAGSLLAWAVLATAFFFVRDPVVRLAGLYGSDYQLAGLGPGGLVVLLLGGVTLGWLGSWLSVAHYMRSGEGS